MEELLKMGYEIACVDYDMVEWTYESEDKVTDIMDNVQSLRNGFADNSIGLALIIAQTLRDNKILAYTVCFENGGSSDHISVWSDLDKEYKQYSHHCVVFLGDSIIDLLHSDDLKPTKEYVEQLQADNHNLVIDYRRSEAVFPDFEGFMERVTIDYMKDYVQMRDCI